RDQPRRGPRGRHGEHPTARAPPAELVPAGQPHHVARRPCPGPACAGARAARPLAGSVSHATKGHGTENDVVPPDDRVCDADPAPELVRALCDRRAGVGGDGLIRLAPSQAHPEGRAVLAEHPGARWFMDYRNADGSIAEMCGNGVRVLAAFLERLGEWDG